jgi:hypothetical protein
MEQFMLRLFQEGICVIGVNLWMIHFISLTFSQSLKPVCHDDGAVKLNQHLLPSSLYPWPVFL